MDINYAIALKSRRASLRLNMSEAARLLGVCRSGYNRWERGGRISAPRVPLVRRFISGDFDTVIPALLQLCVGDGLLLLPEAIQSRLYALKQLLDAHAGEAGFEEALGTELNALFESARRKFRESI